MAQAVGQKQRRLCMIIKVVVEQMVKLCIIIPGAAGQLVRCKFCATFFFAARASCFFGRAGVNYHLVCAQSESIGPGATISALELQKTGAFISHNILCLVLCLVSVIFEQNTSYVLSSVLPQTGVVKRD